MGNPPFVRALHRGVAPGAEVPPGRYRAVAEVSGGVLRRAGRR